MRESRVDKILTQLDEKWVIAFKRNPHAPIVDIYKNPTLQEFKDSGDTIRFIAHANSGDVYIADANKCVHPQMRNNIKVKTNSREDVWGVAKKYDKKWVMTESDTLRIMETPEIEHLFSKNWKKHEKYIKGITSYLKKKVEEKRQEDIEYQKSLKSFFSDESKAVKLLTLIDEVFVKGVQALFGYTNIYVNPKQQELDEFEGDVRFMALSESKKVYVWDAEAALHYQIEEKLGIETSLSKDLLGVAERKGKTWYIKESMSLDKMERYFFEKFLKTDFSWAEKYIKGITAHIKEVEKRRSGK